MFSLHPWGTLQSGCLGGLPLPWEQAFRPGPRLFIMGSHVPHILMPFQNEDARTVLLQAVPGPAWTRDSSLATSLPTPKMGSHYRVTRLWSHGKGFKWVGATQPSRPKSIQPNQVVAPEVTGTELVSVTGEVPARDREMLASPWILTLVTFILGLPLLTKKTEQTSLWARLEKCLWYIWSVSHRLGKVLSWDLAGRMETLLGKKIKLNQKKEFTVTWKGKQFPACLWVWSEQLTLHSKVFFSLVLIFSLLTHCHLFFIIMLFIATSNKGTKLPHLWSVKKLFCHLKLIKCGKSSDLLALQAGFILSAVI